MFTVKKAALAGTTIEERVFDTWVEKSGELKNLLKDFDHELLWCFLGNEFIGDDLLPKLYEKSDPFDKLDDEQWRTLIWATVFNPRICTPHDDTWLDGYAEYRHNRVFLAGWSLFESLPVSVKSAVLLISLGEKLVRSRPPDMDVMTVMTRWSVGEEDKDAEQFEDCRAALAKLIPDYGEKFESFKDSDDRALRKAYYARYEPRSRSDVRVPFEKDGDRFLWGALSNPCLFYSEDIRDELRKCCWDHEGSDLMYPNNFNAK